jgi:hypothetical protein
MTGFDAMVINGMMAETPIVSMSDKRMVSAKRTRRKTFCFRDKRTLSFMGIVLKEDICIQFVLFGISSAQVMPRITQLISLKNGFPKKPPF